MNEQDPHFPRKQAILKEFPDVVRLYGPDKRTLIYVIAVAAVQAGLAVWATTSWWHSILLGITVGPFLDAMILVIMHELSHNRFVQ
jgi:fatty acid desaturase